ncbi:hypothetical protein HYT05_04865 [Candidatus Kaiserbacteria bacterium]|nr:hypothetical protein [Candidatus Kaiserbacteria bacterium]
MPFSSHLLYGALKFFLAGISPILLSAVRRMEEKRQKDAYEKNIERIQEGSQAARAEVVKEVGPFVLNKALVDSYAASFVELAVGRRLQGAIAHYETGNQLECIRHILLALDAICVLLEWEDASAYLNEQNRALYKRSEKRAA